MINRSMISTGLFVSKMSFIAVWLTVQWADNLSHERLRKSEFGPRSALTRRVGTNPVQVAATFCFERTVLLARGFFAVFVALGVAAAFFVGALLARSGASAAAVSPAFSPPCNKLSIHYCTLS